MKFHHFFTFLLLIFIGINACTERDFITSPNARLGFSVDTLQFDTVFTTLGSDTRYFKVYNHENGFLRISNIKLATQNSFFKLNINGVPTSELADEELAPGDSLFIFVEVKIDPQNRNNPVLVRDSVLFETNGNTQHVKLMAYGQDVRIIDGKRLGTQVWDAQRPYLIRNSMLVDTLETLRILPGARLYFEPNSVLYVLGSLQIEGTKTDSVVLSGARLQHLYDDVPGLWGGVWLLPGSVNNRIEYAHVKNAVVGIRADSLIENGNPCLDLHNCRIEHHSAAGIFAQGSSILATNTIVADCGVYAVSLQVGGSYAFYHCTIANYWNYNTRSTPSVVVKRPDRLMVMPML